MPKTKSTAAPKCKLCKMPHPLGTPCVSKEVVTGEVITTRRGELEQVIERELESGMHSFVAVGQALLEIRDQKLYKETHKTFADYCRERWGMSRIHAHRQIDAAKIIEMLPIGNKPANEAQARELIPLLRGAKECACGERFDTPVWHCSVCDHHWPIDVATCSNCHEGQQKVVEVWKGVSGNGPVTAEAVKAAVSSYVRPKREAPPPPAGTFHLLYADPPWRYEFTETENRAIENQYETMALDDICAMEVPAAPDSLLLLWATPPKLEEAMQVIRAWDFSYRTCMVWVKDKIGMGYWARQRHELLLISTRGNFPAPEPSMRPDSVIEAPRGAHSQKPNEVYEIIERTYPEASKIELFARSHREGWESWGAEA